MLKYSFCSMFFLCVFSNSILAVEKTDSIKIKEATSCITIEQKIQRLICFDEVFSTPIYGVKYHSDKPKFWLRATDNELNRNSGVEPLLTLDKKSSDVLVTIPARNVKEGIMPPLLVLSCIGGISRVEFALHNALQTGRVTISLKDNVEELWRSDDSGFLLSARRGAVAKKYIQDILLKNELLIRSDNTSINGLRFSTLNLKAVLSPVRERCGW